MCSDMGASRAGAGRRGPSSPAPVQEAQSPGPGVLCTNSKPSSPQTYILVSTEIEAQKTLASSTRLMRLGLQRMVAFHSST